MEPHFPPKFGHSSKPHVQRVNGEWWVTWPSNWPMPPPRVLESFGPYLRKMNGIIAHQRPTSFVCCERTRVQ